MGALTENPLWRLLPGNPIFVRVVEAGAKRSRHAAIRIGYLGVLLAVTLSLVLAGLAGGGTLTELSRKSARLFTVISFVQLGMACLMAPVFTAGAIMQEKDNQTYDVLLSSPLSNAQIVLGSLMSRLFFVLALLISGIPVFLITQLFGGVTGQSILLSFMIAAATAVFAGAVAMAIAVVRVGTGKTIFAFYLVIGLYIASVWLLDQLPAFSAGGGGQTSYLTAMHPFLSLMVVLNITQPPSPAKLPGAGSAMRFWLCYPHYAYLCWTLSASAVMMALGTIFVRYSNARTRVNWTGRLRQWLTGGRATRKPRSVWNNPVAWREAATQASAGGGGAMRWLFVAAGLAGALVLTIAYAYGAITPATTRGVLQAVLWIELTLVLLVLCNVSASAITRERENGTLELLLVTPITSRYYIWGKLRGLISFAAILLIVPISTAALLAVYGLFNPPAPVAVGALGRKVVIPIVPIEAVAELALSMLSVCALTVMVALTMSLKLRRTIGAVLSTVAIVAVIALGSAACGLVSVEGIPVVGPLIAMASPYVTIAMVTAPNEVAEGLFVSSSPIGFRLTVLIYSLIAAAAYSAVVLGLYSSMVKTFDVIVRRQGR
ncbi:MAG: hypothetical protein HQ546_06055 [Planctomycetes bacterium]|nr:hypothetical protein [Planctomycetota bacterium]